MHFRIAVKGRNISIQLQQSFQISHLQLTLIRNHMIASRFVLRLHCSGFLSVVGFHIL